MKNDFVITFKQTVHSLYIAIMVKSQGYRPELQKIVIYRILNILFRKIFLL